MESRVYKAGEETPDGFTIEVAVNGSDDLPFGLFNPETEGKLTWVCGEGSEGKVISIFSMDLGDHTEREERILEGIEQARFMRDELVLNGWKKLKPPEINFTVTSEGRSAPLNRKQKRELAKRAEKVKPK